MKTTGTISFTSIQGDIDFSGVIQSIDITQATSAHVMATTAAAKTVTFETSESKFAKLTVNSGGGIALKKSVSTTSSNLGKLPNAPSFMIKVFWQ